MPAPTGALQRPGSATQYWLAHTGPSTGPRLRQDQRPGSVKSRAGRLMDLRTQQPHILIRQPVEATQAPSAVRWVEATSESTVDSEVTAPPPQDPKRSPLKELQLLRADGHCRSSAPHHHNNHHHHHQVLIERRQQKALLPTRYCPEHTARCRRQPVAVAVFKRLGWAPCHRIRGPPRVRCFPVRKNNQLSAAEGDTER